MSLKLRPLNPPPESDVDAPTSESAPAPRSRLIAVAVVTATAVVAGSVALGSPWQRITPLARPVVSEALPATANTEEGAVAQNSPTLAVDPSDSRFVALANRIDAPDFGCALQVSADAGTTFVRADPVADLPVGAEKCYAPEVAFDRTGRLYYLFVGLHGAGNTPMGVFLTSSTDRGRTFSPPQQVLGPNAFQVRMAIDRGRGRDGRLHLVWLQPGSEPGLGALPAANNPILAMFSDDGGGTFSRPVTVSDPSRQHVVAPSVAVGRDHAVHVLYYDLKDDVRDYQGLEGPVFDGTWSLVLASSSDGGRTFGPGRVVEDAVVPPTRVMLIFTMPPAGLALGPGRQLFAAWPDARSGDADVLLRSSADGGFSWREPVRVNDDGPGHTQTLPRVGVAPGGRVDVVFYDRRNDPADVRNEVFIASSRDHGRTFLTNRSVSGRAFSSEVGRRYGHPAAQGMVEFGSRLGVLSGRDRVVAAWTDTRNATVPRHQEIFAATVRVARERRLRERWWPVAVGAVLAVLVLGLGVRKVRR